MKKIILILSLGIGMFFTASVNAQSFTEQFDSIPALFTNGWDSINLSQPIGPTRWFQGNATIFPAYSGTGYIGANYANTDSVGTTNTISNWLFAPVRWMHDGDKIIFSTRTVDSNIVLARNYPDRMQVRLSTLGVNSTAPIDQTTVGSYSTLLLDIDSTYSINSYAGGYPYRWRRYVLTLAGLPGGQTSCRFAFRYYVVNGGLNGVNSNYIGIDSLAYITTFSGMENHYNLTDFNFYPNPSNGIVKMSIKASGNQERKINVMDMLGTVVFEKIYTNTFFDMYLGNLNAGMYFINVIDEKGVSSKKLVIQ